jgi:hypothetical protein
MQQTIRLLPVILAITILGCSDDPRLAELAKETNRQQAQQNQEMAKLNREVAEGSKRVVQASAEMTEQLLTIEKELHDKQDELETERKEFAQERRTDSLLGTFLVTAATLVAVTMPLMLSWYLLHSLQKQDEPAIIELLIEELDQATNEFALSNSTTTNTPRHLEAETYFAHCPNSNSVPRSRDRPREIPR